MRSLILAVLFLGCCVLGVALYRHWVEVGPNAGERGDGSERVAPGVAVNKERARKDLDAMKREAKDLTTKAEEKVQQGVDALRGMHSVAGTVTRWNEASQELTVKGKDGTDQSFQVDPQCKVQAGDQVLAVSDLKVGERVAVKYQENKNTKWATAIQVEAMAVSQPEVR
jgi:hypothetical protein